MVERVFPPDGAHGEPSPALDLLRAAILRHLLVHEPRGAPLPDLARTLLATAARCDREALCAAALAALRREGLVGYDGAMWSASDAARAFHRLMLAG
jgi:hypothetical protein